MKISIKVHIHIWIQICYNYERREQQFYQQGQLSICWFQCAIFHLKSKGLAWDKTLKWRKISKFWTANSANFYQVWNREALHRGLLSHRCPGFGSQMVLTIINQAKWITDYPRAQFAPISGGLYWRVNWGNAHWNEKNKLLEEKWWNILLRCTYKALASSNPNFKWLNWPLFISVPPFLVLCMKS